MIPKKITRTLITVLVIFLLIGFSAVGFYFGFAYVLSQNARFAKLETQFKTTPTTSTGSSTPQTQPGAVELVIPRAADTQQIAEILKDKGIIENTFVFTLLSKFNGFDGSYMAGTHFVSPDMSYDEIMYVLSQKPKSVRVTFPEGLTYSQVKARLRAAGVNFDEAVLDSMVRNPQIFLDYDFVTGIEKRDGRDWLLQGYLYPDTYEFDMNTDEETIIRTFLNNTENKLVEEYYARAAKIGMSMDRVITLASIIQNECSLVEEMRSVSGVFHNRLKRTDYLGLLQSCATVNYLLKESGQETALWLADKQIEQFAANPYNTYYVKGLPPGPICSPGEDAIRAALWPETTKNLYFCASGKGDGSNLFATTQAQHEKNIATAQADAARLAKQAAAAKK